MESLSPTNNKAQIDTTLGKSGVFLLVNNNAKLSGKIKRKRKMRSDYSRKCLKDPQIAIDFPFFLIIKYWVAKFK